MTQTATEGPGPRLTLGRLRFPDDLEARYEEYYFEHSLLFVRLGVVLAIVLFTVFGILDLVLVPNEVPRLWLIRFGIVCPLAGAVFILTYTQWFKPMMQRLMGVLTAVCGLGVVAIIAVAGTSAGYLYYAGLLLVIPAAYTLLQLRFAWATVVCLVMIGAYEVVAIWTQSLPGSLLLTNNAFILSSLSIGMVAGYTLERGARTEFLQRRLIETQREELARQNVQLDSALQATLDELQASRARIVAAGDAERRRIEHNIHDGAQQRLVGVSVRMSLATQLSEEDPAEARKMLQECQQLELKEAVAELRSLAHGIYPPLLMEEGLAKALSVAATRAPLPTTVMAASLPRYPEEVETAVYFCCMEALQNACRHAGKTASVAISVHEDEGALVFEVTDDGTGFDPVGQTRGAGFVNMGDRLGTLGGDMRVESTPGAGTKVTGVVPVESGQDRAVTEPVLEAPSEARSLAPGASVNVQPRHPGVVTTSAAEAVKNAQAWFEVNSGWAPPDEDELAEWVADGVCRCPDECLVDPEGWCEHGLASWWLILGELDGG